MSLSFPTRRSPDLADAGIWAREYADRAAAEILEHRRQIVHHEIRAAAIVDAIAAREFGHFGGGEPQVARDIDVPTMIVARVPASGLASDDAVGADARDGHGQGGHAVEAAVEIGVAGDADGRSEEHTSEL